MKYLTLLFLLSFSQGGGSQTVTVPVHNPSFEIHAPFTYGDQCGVKGGWAGVPVSGWQFSNGASAFQPTQPNPCGIRAFPLPDGSTVALAGAYTGTSTISQDTGVKASDFFTMYGDGVYTMTFYVANYFNVYPGFYQAKLLIEEHELCATEGWGTPNWTQITLVCPAPSYSIVDQWVPPDPTPEPSELNYHLIISFAAVGPHAWPVLFDDISLTFTPK